MGNQTSQRSINIQVEESQRSINTQVEETQTSINTQVEQNQSSINPQVEQSQRSINTQVDESQRSTTLTPPAESSLIPEISDETDKKMIIRRLAEQLCSTDEAIHYAAVLSLCQFISKNHNLWREVLDDNENLSGLLNSLASTSQDLQLPGNNTCDEQCTSINEVVETEAIPSLLSLFDSSYSNFCEELVRMLEKLVADGADPRDLLINDDDIVDSLVQLAQPEAPVQVLRTLALVACNLCHKEGCLPTTRSMSDVLPALQVLVKIADTRVLVNTLAALRFLTYNEEMTQIVIDSGLIPKVVELVAHGEVKVKLGAFILLGNIIAGTRVQAQAVLDCGVLARLYGILNDHQNENIRDALWLLSNVTAGTPTQIQWVINHQLLPGVFTQLQQGELRTQKEAAWVIHNLIQGGDTKQVYKVVNNSQLLQVFSTVLSTCEDEELLLLVLTAFKYLLENCKWSLMASTTIEEYIQSNLTCAKIEGCDLLESIETLLSRSSIEVYKMAFQIIELYI